MLRKLVDNALHHLVTNSCINLIIFYPTIAAISGYCVAGGLELALMCDLRVMEESAKTGFLNRRFGVPLIDGGSVRLPELIG